MGALRSDEITRDGVNRRLYYAYPQEPSGCRLDPTFVVVAEVFFLVGKFDTTTTTSV